ncbi:MAG TPA: cysteine dioxygenase family protein [Pyrinomonadaceae bacterium]|jgi:cysteine dioxygenase
MSTTVTSTTRASRRGTKKHPAHSSLGALIERLSALTQSPPLSEFNEWLQEVKVDAAELQPHVGFKSGTYARHLIFRSEFLELLVLCWKPGQRTPIHDHNGSYGAVRVLEGVLWETMFTLETHGLAYHSSREWQSGHVTGADVPDIHQLGNPEVSGQDLITLHLYAPPLRAINTYRIGETESESTINMNSWNPTI